MLHELLRAWPENTVFNGLSQVVQLHFFAGLGERMLLRPDFQLSCVVSVLDSNQLSVLVSIATGGVRSANDVVNLNANPECSCSRFNFMTVAGERGDRSKPST